MRIRGIGRLRQAVRRLSNRFAPGVPILLYHRVAELPADPQLLAVTPQRFVEHLHALQRHARPMQLQQVVRALRDGNLPNRAVVITFDDGYADNLYQAKPLLERYDIPATVFVTTGVGHNREFWWDELDRLLLQPGMLPEILHLSIQGRTYTWELGEAVHYSEEAYQRHRNWNVLEKNDPSPRQHLYRSLCLLLRPLPERERRKVLDELLAWAGTESIARPTHRALSPDEVIHLAEGGLVEVGAHTVTHSVLSVLPLTEQWLEILESKVSLEEILGHSITSFAYPFGSLPDYTAETVAAVRKAGFACACSNFADLVRRGTDRFQLPRVLVRDWDGDEFLRHLRYWIA
jgi:peptidoglycan/xylan/chitin deacetylase (PgdA/CDA1 family)